MLGKQINTLLWSEVQLTAWLRCLFCVRNTNKYNDGLQFIQIYKCPYSSFFFFFFKETFIKYKTKFISLKTLTAWLLNKGSLRTEAKSKRTTARENFFNWIGLELGQNYCSICFHLHGIIYWIEKTIIYDCINKSSFVRHFCWIAIHPKIDCNCLHSYHNTKLLIFNLR